MSSTNSQWYEYTGQAADVNGSVSYTWNNIGFFTGGIINQGEYLPIRDDYFEVDHFLDTVAAVYHPTISFASASIGGGAGNDTIIGSGERSDYLSGGSGDDKLYLGGGIIPGVGFGQFTLGFGMNVTEGQLMEAFSNVGIGGSGNDTIVGGAQNDYIAGDSGVDVLIGGGGNDVFQFVVKQSLSPDYKANYDNSGRDYIADFEFNKDRVLIQSEYIKTYADLLLNASIYQDETSTVIEFNNGDGILVLTNFNVTNVSSAMFAFDWI
jgi:Ca2+-binding RTX toxin-like protein